MRLVFVTQRVDEDDPALGATVDKLRALAARVDELVVLALDAVPTELPSNVRVKTFGGGSRALRGARLVGALAPELRRRPVAVVAHMAPIYAVLAAPLARPLRVPLVLWFTHWRTSPTLRLAERLSTRVVSVDRRSFPFASAKLVPLGHGIDVDALPLVTRPATGPLRVLALGRTSPAKGLRAIVDAVAAVDGAELELRGPSLTAEERAYRDELGVPVQPPVPRGEIASVYAAADVLVNNMRAGALDKVVFEAAASGLPVLVASDGFDGLVGGLEPPLRFPQDDDAEIARRLRALIELGADGRRALGAELRERVRSGHSVEHWAEALLAATR